LENNRADYSELVTAIQQGDDETSERLLRELSQRLISYLCVVMNAPVEAAKDCVQEAILITLEKIKEDKIKYSKAVFAYLINTARNEYLRYNKGAYQFDPFEDSIRHLATPAQQVERMKILEQCISEMVATRRKFIKFYFEDLSRTNKDAMKRFKMSSGAVRAKKSHIVSELHECYKRKTSV